MDRNTDHAAHALIAAMWRAVDELESMPDPAMTPADIDRAKTRAALARARRARVARNGGRLTR
jgi:hypothetical protein